MNQMEIFSNQEFGSIRTFEQDGKVLFCGKDIAKALGYQRTADAITAHCKGVCVLPTPSNGGIQRMKFIPEGDVYRLIVHSKLPSAERFERWVFDEVLPSIRKHGAYITREKLWEVATSPEAMMKLCSDLLAEREENAVLRKENAMLEGKAAFMTCLSTSSTAPTSAPPPKNWLCRSAGLSDSCWNSGLCTAPRPGMCCLMQSLPTTACLPLRTTAIMGIPAPIHW